MQHRIHALRMRTIIWLIAIAAIPALPGTAKAQAPAAPEAGAQAPSPRLLAEASWHGRPIQRPLARRSDATDRAPTLAPGTGYRRPGGSRRVRDLQRRLTRLGYRPGRSDGLFGPRTQAALLAFQHKHGLAQTGAVGATTLEVLRRRTAPGARPEPAEPPVRAQSSPQETTPQDAPPPSAPVVPAQSTDGGLPTLTMILLLALALPLLMLAGLLLRGRRTAADGPTAQPEPLSLPAGDPPAAADLREREAPAGDEPLREEPEIPADEIPRVRRVPRAAHVPSQERRAALRERILAMRDAGMSLQEIADQLTEEGEVTAGGARQWQTWSVRAATRAVPPRSGPRTHNPGRPGGGR